MRTLMIGLACGLLAMSGCGPSDKVAKTPKEAVEHLAEAMDEGDADAFAECFDVTPEDKPVMRALGDFAATVAGLQKEMVKEYGADSAGGLKSGGPGQMAQAFDKSRLEKLQIKIDGDTATAVMPDGSGEPMALKKVGERWLIDLGDKLQDAEQREQMMKMIPKMTDAIKAVKEKIGEPGMTAEKINEEFGAAIMKVAFEAMGEAMKVAEPQR